MPAVGPLSSLQSLPFINIYSSSSTKNNILELREQEKKNQCELDLVITCATGPQGRGCMRSTHAVRPLAASPSSAT